MNPTILVTGGAGYIGAHACVTLIEAGFAPLVLDNLCNSSAESLRRVGRISGVEPRLIVADIRDAQALDALFAAQPIAAVMHFAGLKAVGESTRDPLRYHDNNVGGSIVLLQAMRRAAVRTLIFSSSATVYGEPGFEQFREDMRCDPVNPYGRGKWMIEQVLADLAASEAGWRIANLRYFNPVGAHDSGLIGEDPRGVPNNLMPTITQVAVSRLPRLRVFGGDWPTPDGSGVRDYIHVMDLAEGHVAAMRHLLAHDPALLTLNLGSGRGISVLQMLHAFEQVLGRALPCEIVARRPGDIAAYWADPTRAARVLGWRTQRDLHAMCRDAWRWQQGNPQGYALD
ncbi:MAG: UDP-glucose 4-epimerase GalE [Metallibacterium sp.]